MTHDPKSAPYTDNDVVTAARREHLDPRTLIRALAGLPVRGTAGERAARAAEQLHRGRPAPTKDR